MSIEQPPITSTAIQLDKFTQIWRNWFDYMHRVVKSKKAIVKTDTFSTASTAWTDITGLEVTINPSRRSSKFLIRYDISVGLSSSHSVGFKIVRTVAGSSSDVGVGDSASSRSSVTTQVKSGSSVTSLDTTSMAITDSPNSTQIVTYKVQVKNLAAGTVYINRTSTDTDSASFPRAVSSIQIEEVN